MKRWHVHALLLALACAGPFAVHAAISDGPLAVVRDNLPYVLSAITIYMNLLAGNKHPLAWAVGLANQALWLGWIIWRWDIAAGFLPMNLALWIVYGRNHMKWNRTEVI